MVSEEVIKMSNSELMDLIGRAFAYGEVDNLASHLSFDCKYESEYAHRTIKTAEKITERMKEVYSNVTDESRYTYQIISLDNILRDIKHEDLNTGEGTHVNDLGLFLFQYSDKYPVAVVVVMLSNDGIIKNILLSRNVDWFNVDFYNSSGTNVA